MRSATTSWMTFERPRRVGTRAASDLWRRGSVMLDRSENRVIGWMLVSVCGLVASPLLAQPHGIAFGNAGRFFPSAEVAASAPPSFAFESTPRVTKAIPGDFEYVPEYSVEGGRTTAKLKLPEGASLY